MDLPHKPGHAIERNCHVCAALRDAAGACANEGEWNNTNPATATREDQTSRSVPPAFVTRGCEIHGQYDDADSVALRRGGSVNRERGGSVR